MSRNYAGREVVEGTSAAEAVTEIEAWRDQGIIVHVLDFGINTKTKAGMMVVTILNRRRGFPQGLPNAIYLHRVGDRFGPNGTALGRSRGGNDPSRKTKKVRHVFEPARMRR